MASLIMIERSFMVSGIQSVPEQSIPPKFRKYHSIVRRVHPTFGFLSYASFLLSLACFAFIQAKTFTDYVEIATFFLTTSLVLIFYASFALQSSKVSEALTDLKSIVEQSESTMKSEL